MAVLVPGKFLYLANLRVASRATARALRPLSRLSDKEIFKRHHCSLGVVKELCDYQGELVICTIRNPWDQLVSAYHMFGKEGDTFEQFLMAGKWSNKDTPVNLWLHYEDANLIWRYETLIEDITKTCAEFDIPPLDVPVIGKSERLPYCDYYTPKLKAFVESAFADELALGGYDY